MQAFRCLFCDHPNAFGTRFCEACGSSLEKLCETCGAVGHQQASRCYRCATEFPPVGDASAATESVAPEPAVAAEVAPTAPAGPPTVRTRPLPPDVEARMGRRGMAGAALPFMLMLAVVASAYYFTTQPWPAAESHASPAARGEPVATSATPSGPIPDVQPPGLGKSASAAAEETAVPDATPPAAAAEPVEQAAAGREPVGAAEPEASQIAAAQPPRASASRPQARSAAARSASKRMARSTPNDALGRHVANARAVMPARVVEPADRAPRPAQASPEEPVPHESGDDANDTTPARSAATNARTCTPAMRALGLC